jgi:hypothetical protein
MSETIKSEKISRRRTLELVGAFAFAMPTLIVSHAEAQTPGMERREDRREGRTDRREDRRDRRDDRQEGRSDRREDRRTPQGTTGAQPAK